MCEGRESDAKNQRWIGNGFLGRRPRWILGVRKPPERLGRHIWNFWKCSVGRILSATFFGRPLLPIFAKVVSGIPCIYHFCESASLFRRKYIRCSLVSSPSNIIFKTAMMSMDLDQAVALPQIHQQTPTILCCNCGAPIDGTTAAGAMVCS